MIHNPINPFHHIFMNKNGPLMLFFIYFFVYFNNDDMNVRKVKYVMKLIREHEISKVHEISREHEISKEHVKLKEHVI